MGYCFNLSVDHLSGSYCPGGPDSDFEYSTQSYTGYEVRGKYSLQYYIYLRTFFPVFYFFVKVNYRLFLAGVYFKHVIFLLCHIYIYIYIYIIYIILFFFNFFTFFTSLLTANIHEGYPSTLRPLSSDSTSGGTGPCNFMI